MTILSIRLVCVRKCLQMASAYCVDRSELTKIKGIGGWTADIFLLMALHRPDIWPKGDLALAVAIQHLKKLEVRPTQREIEDLSESWKPWRAVAARLLWRNYLCCIA